MATDPASRRSSAGPNRFGSSNIASIKSISSVSAINAAAGRGHYLTTAFTVDSKLAVGQTTKTIVAFDRDPRMPMPGSLITRTYKGRDIVVKVLPQEFECEGECIARFQPWPKR